MESPTGHPIPAPSVVPTIYVASLFLHTSGEGEGYEGAPDGLEKEFSTSLHGWTGKVPSVDPVEVEPWNHLRARNPLHLSGDLPISALVCDEDRSGILLKGLNTGQFLGRELLVRGDLLIADEDYPDLLLESTYLLK